MGICCYVTGEPQPSPHKIMAAVQQASEFLSSNTSEVIEFKGEITDISSHLSPIDAFQIIVEKGYLSAPVYVENANGKEYSGFLDTRTLVSWLVFAYDDKNTKPNLQDIVAKMTERAIDNVSVTCKYLQTSFN